jgi:exopolysaccharide biosynthesis polyprenyl glycosylphosphotransferase
MKRFELTVALLLVPLDAFMLTLAAVAAYNSRFIPFVTQYRPVIFALDFQSYLQHIIPLVALWVVIYALAGLYSIRHPRRILTELKKIFVASSLGFAAITMIIFLRGELFSSRFIILAAYVLAMCFVAFARMLVRALKFSFYKRGIGARRVMLIGNDKTAKTVADFLSSDSHYGMRVIKTVPDPSEMALAGLAQELRQLQPDLILQGTVQLSREESERLLDFAREHHLEFHYAADLFDTKAANTNISTIGDVPIVEIKPTSLEGWGRIYKRTLDLIVGIIGFILASPVMLIVAIAIKLDSKGPIIYKNERVGKGGKLFNVYKFRRMKQQFNTGGKYDKDGKAAELEKQLIKERSHREGPLYKIADDPRNTRVGKFIEKTSLDELPQFFNVINGSMSLVGPRPHQPREVDLYQKHHKRVLGIKPGVTGLAQISGRSDLDFEEEVRLDTYYIENWTARMDFAVMLKTPLALLKKHK